MMKKIFASGYYPSPLGLLKLDFTPAAILKIEFISRGCEKEGYYNGVDFQNKEWRKAFNLIFDQFNSYFRGYRKNFTLPCKLEGTAFEKEVWNAIKSIPYGETMTYGEIARTIGREGAWRAVGQASNKNPLPIIIPCHRVVGTNGSLRGYAGGEWRKKWLLEHEKGYELQVISY